MKKVCNIKVASRDASQTFMMFDADVGVDVVVSADISWYVDLHCLCG